MHDGSLKNVLSIEPEHIGIRYTGLKRENEEQKLKKLKRPFPPFQ